MKKLLLVFAGILASLCLMAGCSTNNNPASPAADDINQTGEGMTDDPQKAIDNALDMGAAETGNTKQPDETQFISVERAKTIALEKAGLTADVVKFDKVELDFDNGVWMYEVEFQKGNTEYDADIKADDGTILMWDVDYND